MTDSPRSGRPFVWVTWLTGLLAREQQCVFASWHKAHFRYAKLPDSTFDSAAWTADHAALVQRRAGELVDEGWRVRIENENAFRLKGQSAIVAGKMDIVALRDGVVRIVDAKTGQQKHRDFFQLLIYLFALPKCWPELADHAIEGEVCYRDHTVPIGGHELTATRIAEIAAAVKAVAAAAPPQPVPSAGECGRCDVASCTARVDSDIVETAVGDF